jgi:hypothetical protein
MVLPWLDDFAQGHKFKELLSKVTQRNCLGSFTLPFSSGVFVLVLAILVMRNKILIPDQPRLPRKRWRFRRSVNEALLLPFCELHGKTSSG